MAILPLLWLSTAFLCGIWLASWQSLPWTVWGGAAVIALIFGFFENRFSPGLTIFKRWRESCPLPAGILLAALLAGAARYTYAQPVLGPASLAWYNDSGQVRLIGIVISPPGPGVTANRMQVNVDQLDQVQAGQKENPQKVSGKLLVSLLPGSRWQYGDVLEIQGNLETPPVDQGTSYKDFLARQNIFSQMIYPKVQLLRAGQGSRFRGALFSLSRYCYGVINRSLPQPEAALLNGILLGVDDDLPESVQKAFRDTGTAHIIAISGFNIAILAGLISIVIGRLLPRLWGLLATIVLISAYTLLVGASASVVRAAIMGSLSLIGAQIGRRQTGLNTLAFVAALMCLGSPVLLWDVSFQLSFLATLGLVLFASRFQEGFERLIQSRVPSEISGKISKVVGEYVLFTLAAQIMTLPVMAFHFQRLSLSSLLANPLVLPPQPLVMILGGLALLGGLIFQPLGQILGYLVWPLLAYTIRMVELLAALPVGAFSIGEIDPWLVFMFYALLMGGLFLWWRRVMLPAWLGWISLAGLGLLAVLAWRAVLGLPDGRLHIVVMDVADSAALLIQTPSGNHVLVNAGRDSTAFSSSLGRLLPLTSPHLDGLVLSSSAAAGLLALPSVLERFPAHAVYWSSDLKTSRALEALQGDFYLKQVPVSAWEAGQTLDLGDGPRLSVLATSPVGTALLVEFQRFRALAPGGVSASDLVNLVPDNLAGLSLLVLTKNDLVDSSIDDWKRFRPVVVVSQENTPADDPAWIGLAEHGWVSTVSDGNELWLESGK